MNKNELIQLADRIFSELHAYDKIDSDCVTEIIYYRNQLIRKHLGITLKEFKTSPDIRANLIEVIDNHFELNTQTKTTEEIVDSIFLDRIDFSEDDLSEVKSNLDVFQKTKIVKLTINNITNYGIFGLVDGKFEGFIHAKDFSWTEQLIPSDVFNVGDVVDAVILEFAEKQELIKLGIKQLVENPWGEFFDKHKENTIVKFEINSVCSHGVYGLIDGKIRGFVHVTELSWTEYLNPDDVFNVGGVVDAFVLEINEGRKIVQLGVKQLVENPWEVFLNKNNKGDIVKGEVFAVSDFGVIIKLPEGVAGTLHNDDISYDEDYRHCFVKGQKVDVILLDLDAERERISLGIKQINPSPWDKFMECNKTGTIVTALIKGFYGEKMIAEIGDGIDAFVKIKLDETGQQTNKPLDIGDEMKAEILSIDKRNRIIEIACFLKDSI